MQKISEVERAITLNQELLAETKKRIQETSTKLSGAQGNVKRIEAEIKDAKEKRQAALARGGDSNGLNNSLKKSESELELETETCKGLEVFLAELRAEDGELHIKAGELPKRRLQLQAVEIAARYNELASGIALVVRELNAALFKLDSSGCGGKHGRVVFLPDGLEFLEKVPRLIYDSEALNLDGYIRKNVTCTPWEPGDTEKYFYVWGTHRQDLINNR